MKLAVLDDYQNVTLKLADWSVLSPDVDIDVFTEHYSGLEFLEQKLDGYDMVLAMRERTPFNFKLLESLPDLKLMITTGMRNASIDLEAATQFGIPVCGTRGGGPATAELAWGLILSMLRHIPYEDNAVRNGGWQTTLGVELMGKTLGVLGLGNLGSHVAAVGKAFGMNVIAWSENLTEERATACGARLVSKAELFSQSDVISIHVVLSGRTRGLVGKEDLALMKPTAYLVNTSRGPVVDEDALIGVLEAGGIAGAGIDVYEPEPLAIEHRLRQLPNTVLTPHLGYVTEDTYRIFFNDAIEDIKGWLVGKPVRLLNPDVHIS